LENYLVLYKGNIHFRLGEFEEANKGPMRPFLQKTGKENFYRSLALEGLGFLMKGKRNMKKP